jgi:hypothetical protein
MSWCLDALTLLVRLVFGRRLSCQRMGAVIAELRLLRRQQSEQHFPTMILERSELASVKASAVVE